MCLTFPYPDRRSIKKRINLFMIGLAFGLVGCSSSTLVSVSTSEPNAKIFVEGKLIGETPLTDVEVKNSGNTTVLRIEKKGFVTVEKSYSSNQKTFTINVELIPEVHTEDIIINTIPSKATIYIDGQQVGISPIDVVIDDLVKKNHKLKIEKRGYETKFTRIRYKGSSYQDDNFVDDFNINLELSLSTEEEKKKVFSPSTE